jgi:hypothetical protein
MSEKETNSVNKKTVLYEQGQLNLIYPVLAEQATLQKPASGHISAVHAGP